MDMPQAWTNIRDERDRFEQTKQIIESVQLRFEGVDGYDVYNPSIPFTWQGELFIYGRVEKRDEWARSWTGLFRNTGPDHWTLATDSLHQHHHQLEDPYIAVIDGQLVLGGTHVQMERGKIDTYYGYFYKGTDLADLVYFTTGPTYMKDIRLVKLRDGRIGVFSRPRNDEVMAKYGCESLIGFTIIDSLNDLGRAAVQEAPFIPDFFGRGEWGGCNQAYLLDDDRIGVIGHHSYLDGDQQVYTNIAFVFDPTSREVTDRKVIGTRPCYPSGPMKKPTLADCAFPAGIVTRPDGMVDLYSGLSDCTSGRVTIPNPFSHLLPNP